MPSHGGGLSNTHTNARTHARTYTHTHAHMHTHAHTRTHTLSLSLSLSLFHTHTNIRTHTNTHTFTHTHSHLQKCFWYVCISVGLCVCLYVVRASVCMHAFPMHGPSGRVGRTGEGGSIGQIYTKEMVEPKFTRTHIQANNKRKRTHQHQRVCAPIQLRLSWPRPPRKRSCLAWHIFSLRPSLRLACWRRYLCYPWYLPQRDHPCPPQVDLQPWAPSKRAWPSPYRT